MLVRNTLVSVAILAVVFAGAAIAGTTNKTAQGRVLETQRANGKYYIKLDLDPEDKWFVAEEPLTEADIKEIATEVRDAINNERDVKVHYEESDDPPPPPEQGSTMENAIPISSAGQVVPPPATTG